MVRIYILTKLELSNRGISAKPSSYRNYLSTKLEHTTTFPIRELLPSGVDTATLCTQRGSRTRFGTRVGSKVMIV